MLARTCATAAPLPLGRVHAMIINPTARGKRSEAKILGELDALHVYELIRPGMGN